jgi:hypothetical protein
VRRTWLGGLAALLALVPAPAPAAADAVLCRFEARFQLMPGLSVLPGRGEFTSGGETGTITCHGSLPAGAVTGPGTFGADGRYGTGSLGDTCLTGGEGDGVQSFTIPTAGGSGHGTNPITFRYGATTGRVLGGTFRGPAFAGTFDIASFEGDCVTQPMTAVVLRGEGSLSG